MELEGSKLEGSEDDLFGTMSIPSDLGVGVLFQSIATGDLLERQDRMQSKLSGSPERLVDTHNYCVTVLSLKTNLVYIDACLCWFCVPS